MKDSFCSQNSVLTCSGVRTLKMLLYCLLACSFSDKESFVIWDVLSPYAMCFYPLNGLKIFSSSLVVSSLTVTFAGMLFTFTQLGVCGTSWICKFESFGNFVIIFFLSFFRHSTHMLDLLILFCSSLRQMLLYQSLI